jgi:hypothetical protein
VRAHIPRPLALLTFCLIATISCETTQPPPTSVSLHLIAPYSLGTNEEELIGDTLFGVTDFYQHTRTGLRARYLVTLNGNSDSTQRMFYQPTEVHRWGWYTAQPNNDNCTGGHERHDVVGHGTVDTVPSERHCVANGTHTVRLWRVTWDSLADTIVQWDTLFIRKVAMLGTRGRFSGDPLSSGVYHDVRVTFDATDAQLSFSGDIRAGSYYISPGSSTDSVYADRDTFTIVGGDSLWFQSTYLGTGSGRSWDGDPKAMLTAFNFDYENTPTNFTGGVNSRPHSETLSALYLFPARGNEYRVVGRVVAPIHRDMPNGALQANSSIYVSVPPLDACFTATGYRVTGQTMTFDG